MRYDSAGESSEAIIVDTIKRQPELQYAAEGEFGQFSRWRQFVGSYELPALPTPLFVVQLAGKTDVRYWDRGGWSERTAFPGSATIVPADMPTRWLVDGELDVVTFSIDPQNIRDNNLSQAFSTMRFAFSDPLGSALTNQIVKELHRACKAENDQRYLDSLIGTLKEHVLRGPHNTAAGIDYPASTSSSYRVHQAMNAIISAPERKHSLDLLAERAGVSESYFCRVFKQSTGLTPYQYVLKVRIERARRLLCESQESIGKIATLTGFADQSQFTKAFRKFTGEAPTEFRRRSNVSYVN